MEILGTVTPAVERISIDEAFLDVSGSTHLFGTPETIARRLRAQVRHEVGLPIRSPVIEVTLLAVAVSNLVGEHHLQLELPLQPEDPRRPGSATGAARWAVDRTMDAVRARFGRNAVGYLPIELSRSGGVPEEFRELAEHDL